MKILLSNKLWLIEIKLLVESTKYLNLIITTKHFFVRGSVVERTKILLIQSTRFLSVRMFSAQ